MQPIPLVDPQTIRPILAFRERIGEYLHLQPVPRIANAPLPLAFAGQLFEELADPVLMSTRIICWRSDGGCWARSIRAP